jgi:phage repressor protein C with HTH and peptisase S24 domain
MMETSATEELPLLDENELTKVAEGDKPLSEDVDEQISVDNKLIKTVDESREQAIARVPGDSMAGTINAEDRVVIEIEEGGQIVQGAVYMWANGRGGVIIMRAHWVDAQTVRLVPDNEDYPTIELEGDRDEWEWTCIARVTQVLSGI